MMTTESLRIVRATKGPRAFGAHAAFNRQKIKAVTLCEIVSTLITPSTAMRQPEPSLSPCAIMFPKVAARLD